MVAKAKKKAAKSANSVVVGLDSIKKKGGNGTIKKVAIVNIRSEKVRYLPMYGLLLAKALEKRHNVEAECITVMNHESFQDHIDDLKAEGFDMILFFEYYSTKAGTYVHAYLDFAKMFKEQSKVPIAFGGYWATDFCREFKEFEIFDVNYRGYSLENLADAVVNFKPGKKIVECSGRTRFKDFELDLSKLRYPQKHIVQKSLWGYISSFSCPKNCTFCFANAARSIGAEFSRRPIEMVYQDLEELEKYYDYDYLIMKDLNIFYDPKRAMKIFRWLKDHGKKVDITLDITVKDVKKEVIDELREIGVASNLYFGLESTIEKRREGFRKPYTDAELHKACKVMQDHNCAFVGNVMLGFPWQDKKEIQQEIDNALHFMNKYTSAYFVFCSFMPEYGTDLQKEFFPDLHERLSFREIVDLYQQNVDDCVEKMYPPQFKQIPLRKIFILAAYITRFKETEQWGQIKLFQWIAKKCKEKFMREFKICLDKKRWTPIDAIMYLKIYQFILVTVIPILRLKPKTMTMDGVVNYFRQIFSFKKNYTES